MCLIPCLLSVFPAIVKYEKSLYYLCTEINPGIDSTADDTMTDPNLKLSLQNYKGIFSLSGILVAFVYLNLERFPLLFEDIFLFEDTFSLIIMAALLFLTAVLLYFGSIYINLRRAVKELSEPFVLQDVNFIRNKITVKDDRSRVYTITYKAKFLRHRHPFEWFEESSDTHGEMGFYEVQTPLRRSPQNGSLPWFAKVIKKGETIILSSTLSKKTAQSQLNQRLTSLGKIAHNIDLYGYGEGNP